MHQNIRKKLALKLVLTITFITSFSYNIRTLNSPPTAIPASLRPKVTSLPQKVAGSSTKCNKRKVIITLGSKSYKKVAKTVINLHTKASTIPRLSFSHLLKIRHHQNITKTVWKMYRVVFMFLTSKINTKSSKYYKSLFNNKYCML